MFNTLPDISSSMSTKLTSKKSECTYVKLDYQTKTNIITKSAGTTQNSAERKKTNFIQSPRCIL